MTKSGINPKSLKGWCGQHPHERKILALLETDWPGTQEVSQKAMEYLKLHCSGSSNGNVGNDIITNAAILIMAPLPSFRHGCRNPVPRTVTCRLRKYLKKA
ncbi:MAG: hypothetical protein NTX45_12590 [Proteobacteria bacterium]|nr:hypothetical protein [Pseudomonadota bacterium]